MIMMNSVPEYERPEVEQKYFASIEKLLEHYEDGWNVFINAHKAKDYDFPLTRKEQHQSNPYIPETWLELTDAVIQIIAKEKYDLDVYPNLIEIIRADQMLDAYTTTGLPNSYRHWSFGKRRAIEEKKYDASKHLAYEIVINSSPCLAYCMDTNTPLLQMIVIAHASYGHNAVFKGNYLFQGYTDAETILIDNQRMQDFVSECEQKYGWKEVSEFLDFCHAMRFLDMPDTMKRKRPRDSEIKKKQQEMRVQSHLNVPRASVFNLASEGEQGRQADTHPRFYGQKNILDFMRENAPHLPSWKREIMGMVGNLSQYFKPQVMTKVLNEGMATFMHDKIITTMRDIGLIDFGMYSEYVQINQGVTYQQPAVRVKKQSDGKEVEVLVGASMNPYTLGLKILQEIERICKNPTEEDKEWFPHFAGDKDWLSMVKHAVFSSNDETFIAQYLSPQAMRDLKMFAIEDRALNTFFEVTAIHAGEGFRRIREDLASDYRISDKIPDIYLYDYQDKTDRCLILRHRMFNGKLLDDRDTQAVLEHMHRHWGHPIVIESIDEDGDVIMTYSSPEEYDYTEYSLAEPQPSI